MNTPTLHSARSLPRNTRTRMQHLLDEGDTLFFANNPAQTERRRFYFKDERIDDHGEPTRYVTVSRDDSGRLIRRFEQEGGQA